MSISETVPFLRVKFQSQLLLSLRRMAGFGFGLGTQALFVVTVVGLYSFLRYGVPPGNESWQLIDALLAIQFVIPHSVLLHPTARKHLRPWISPELHGAFFCLCTCLSLLLLFRFWKGSEYLLWDLSGIGAHLVSAGFFLSWAALLYSISLTGLGYQTGLTQWLCWYRNEKIQRREFVPRGVYRLLRHPVYLSFLGLIWFTPTMSGDRAVLTGIWSAYIAIGSVLKDRRLQHYLGETYSQYMTKVPGYPGISAGPLGRLPLPSRYVEAHPRSAPSRSND